MQTALGHYSIKQLYEGHSSIYRHTTTFPNPEIIIQGAKHFCMMGDNTFLEEKLAYLRSVDAITHVEQPSPGQDNIVA